MEKVRKILESYHVFPVEIDKRTDKLYRVKSNNHTYALKKSRLTEEYLPFWYGLFQTAQAENLHHILPVYVNNSRNLYSKDGKDIYYLTPWIDTERRVPSIEKVYRSLGFIHAKTRKMQTVTKESREHSRESFLKYRQQMADLRKNLLGIVEQFEASHFMSPVELLVCTQYRDLVKAFYLLDKRLEQYLEVSNDLEDWQVCLCHGNLIGSHILQGQHIYFINWEYATYQHPIMDLSFYLKDRTKHYDTGKEQLMEKFHAYMDENKLAIHELVLLSIYLLDPSIYIQSIESFITGTTKDSSMDKVIQLQRLHRQILFGIHFSEYVESEYEMVPLDESSSEA